MNKLKIVSTKKPTIDSVKIGSLAVGQFCQLLQYNHDQRAVDEQELAREDVSRVKAMVLKKDGARVECLRIESTGLSYIAGWNADDYVVPIRCTKIEMEFSVELS